MPPTTDPFSRNFLDEQFVWMIADKKEREKERQAVWTHTGPETSYGPGSDFQFRARGYCRSQASPADPNRFAINRFASSNLISLAGHGW